MDFEQELERIAGSYASQGYQVTVHPSPQDLPLFARDFRVEILARRANEGVLVTVKRDRLDAAKDTDLPRYAELTAAQPGWRFDFVILQGESSMGGPVRGALEYSDADIEVALREAEQIVRLGYVRSAVIAAWAALEAAMRIRLRASGESVGWGTMPRVMMNELYSNGVLNEEEFRRLERMFQLRNEIAHGFTSPTSDAEDVRFLSEITRRLVSDSRQKDSAA